MKKNVIALAVATAMAAPLAAQAAPTVYGKAHLSIDSINAEDQAGNTVQDNWEVKSRASRVGIKGSEDLGGGLKAVYQMEWQVNMSDANSQTVNSVGSLYTVTSGSPVAPSVSVRSSGTAKDANMTARNQFVGLAGGFGTVVVGRHDTPFKMSTGKLDFFSDEAGDYNSTTGFQDVRADNAIAYISPNFSGMTIAAAIVPGEGSGADGVTAGPDAANGLSDATSVALMYSAGPLYLSLANEVFSSDLIGAGDDYVKNRLGAGYSVAGLDLSLVYETQDDGTFDRNLTQVSAKYNMGANAVKAFYGMADDWSNTTDTGHTAMGVGVDHNFSKSTKAYAQYVTVDGADFSSTNDTNTLSLGMVTKF